MLRACQRWLTAAVCAIATTYGSSALRADDGVVPVAIELVLAIDVSLSVDDIEYRLQIRGLAEAFRQPEVIRLISEHNGGVAVRLLQWSGIADDDQRLPWRLLTDEASVLDYANELEQTPRAAIAYYTGIGNAIDFSVWLIENNPYLGRLRKIDVSGDGRNNTGPEPAEARDRAILRGVTINGLAITVNQRDLDNYYRKHVIGGPAAFVITAESYHDFADAMKLKLIQELTPLTVFRHAPPHRRRLSFPTGMK